MKKLFTASFVLILSLFVVAQDARDLGSAPVSFNNPLYTYGPQADLLVDFSESFEGTTFPPAGWIKANPDGGTGWNRQTVGTTPLPGWNGGVITTPTGGGTGVAYATWNTGGASSNDQWLITPQIMNIQTGDELKFWLQLPGYTNAYAEALDILVSTTGTATANFTTQVALLTWPAGNTDTSWTERTYVLSNFVPVGSNIYIAFREHVLDNLNDGSAVLLDMISVRSIVPVELVSFNANVSDKNVQLTWVTATEVNNRGFEVQRMVGEEFTTVAFVDGYGSTTETKNYSYTDQNLAAGSYSYRLKQVDFDGSFEYSSVVEADVVTPSEFSLAQNYPNPFNPSTMINFALKVDSKVTLKVFNLLGQEVVTLLNQNFAAGPQSFDFNAAGLNSGVYFYQIDARGIDGTNFTATKKMILTK